MQKELGKEYKNEMQRQSFLKDNCDKVEEKGYMKAYTLEQLQGHKENLANLSIKIDEIEDEKKDSAKYFKQELDPLTTQRKTMVSNIRQKAEYVKEICFKFVDQDNKQTGFYNSDGDLIECRPATADELQPNMFQVIRGTGTND